MAKFVCSMTYDLSSDTSEEARQLLRAELVARRWSDRVKERALPRSAVWALRSAEGDETTSAIHDKCTRDLRLAAMAVRAGGRAITVLRAWIHVSGGGTYGLAGADAFKDSPPADG
jgi:hypothetical protein